MALKRAVLTLWLASACAVSMPRPASAQVNVEPLRKELERERLGGRVGASLAGYRGNTEGVVMGALVLVGGHLGRHFGYVNAAGDYSRLGGSTQVAKTFGHVRHNYELLPWLWSEAFAQLESDRFRRIVLRELIGAGSRLAIVKTEATSSYLGLAYLLEYTRITEAQAPADRTTLAHRLSGYATVTFEPSRRVLLSETLYFQPRIVAPSNYHLLSVTALVFSVTDRLASRIDSTLRYESEPPADVGSLDWEIKNSIMLRF